MATAKLTGCMAIPLTILSAKECRRLQKECTYAYKPMGEAERKVIDFTQDGEYLYIPRTMGIDYCAEHGIEVEDCTSFGQEISFPKTPEPRDYQVKPLDQLQELFANHYDVVFKASTAFGKTVVALMLAARLGKSTLVIVDQDNLKKQWIERLTDPNLFSIPMDDIGQVQGPVCNYSGKPVTIAMVQTLCSRDLGDQFYDYFGMVIVDECHTIGAPIFSSILQVFTATYRLLISATPRRRDGLQAAITNNCGPVRLEVSKSHAKSVVYIRQRDTVYSWYGNISPKVGRIINEVCDDGARNLGIAEDALMLWESGRDTLILSDRIQHLKQIQDLLGYMGVPPEEIGLYTGYEPVLSLVKDPQPKAVPEGAEEETPYTPVKFDFVEKRVPAQKLKQILERSTIILATYGKFAKGVDVPRLAGGIDASPRSQAEQVQGRIQRSLPGKLQPIWVTMLDINNYRLVNSFAGRLREYNNTDSRLMEWDGSNEVKEWRFAEKVKEATQLVKELKTMRIEKSNDTHRMYLLPPEEARAHKRKEQRSTIQATLQQAKRKRAERLAR